MKKPFRLFNSYIYSLVILGLTPSCGYSFYYPQNWYLETVKVLTILQPYPITDMIAARPGSTHDATERTYTHSSKCHIAWQPYLINPIVDVITLKRGILHCGTNGISTYYSEYYMTTHTLNVNGQFIGETKVKGSDLGDPFAPGTTQIDFTDTSKVLYFPLSDDERTSVAAVRVVGPVSWNHPSVFPRSASDSPISVGVQIGPSCTLLRDETAQFKNPVRLRIYDVSNPSHERYFFANNLSLNSVWDGRLYVYNKNGDDTPTTQTADSDFISSQTYGMQVDVYTKNTIVANTRQNPSLTTSNNPKFTFDYHQVPEPTGQVNLTVYYKPKF